MFREVNTKINFLQLEEDILRFWKEQGIFSKSIEMRGGGHIMPFMKAHPQLMVAREFIMCCLVYIRTSFAGTRR